MRQASAGLLVLFPFMAAVLAPFFIGCAAQRPLRPEFVTPCGVCPAHTDQIAAPPSRRPLAPGDNPTLRGFADYHAHMFTNLSFGNFLFWGEPFPEDPNATPDIARELRPCAHTSPTHLVTDVAVTAAGEPCHGPDGYPDFRVWPTFRTRLHQQMYIDWVYRAYQYGLRLMTIVITNNESLCELVHKTAPCTDEDVINLQLHAIQQMAGSIAEHEGWWLEIATSPEQARRIIAENRLAVVIGIEVDTLLRCNTTAGGRCSCTPDDIVERLDAYYNSGVRQINPVHMADNGFGGNALYNEILSANHYFRRKYYQDFYNCFDRGVQWTLRGSSAVPFPAQVLSLVTGKGWYAPHISSGSDIAEGHCNVRGLSSDCGRTLIGHLMEKGMLIDMEHMSDRSADDTLTIAEQHSYPVMLSHAWFRDLKLSRYRVRHGPLPDEQWNEQRAEMHRSADTLRRIKAVGGVVGVVTNQGIIEVPATEPQLIANDCDGSSKSFAQAYVYAVEHMESGVGLGTDFNGLNGQPAPRFGPDACSGTDADAGTQQAQAKAQADQGQCVAYGQATVDGARLDRSAAGHRVFDFNCDGLAHYGLLPDLIADLSAVGVPPERLDVLFHSAEAYVQMWEKAQAVASRMRSASSGKEGRAYDPLGQ